MKHNSLKTVLKVSKMGRDEHSGFCDEFDLCGNYSSSSPLGFVGDAGSCYYGLRAIMLEVF